MSVTSAPSMASGLLEATLLDLWLKTKSESLNAAL
jgi:hypothetical protein